MVGLGLHDVFNRNHNVLKNYPVVGHIRYLLEFISPEIHQYFIEGPHDGRPFDREQRAIVYLRARGRPDVMPFGTQLDLMQHGAEFARHSLAPKTPGPAAERVDIGGRDGTPAYAASRLNISAMSFGALSANAVRALNRGAKLGGFFHNTGEGGASTHHLDQGGDLCWQIGTGYFGCRAPDGGFDADRFRETALLPAVKLIEIKLSQGAKPSHGGVLPAAKITAEIAAARGIARGADCLSPPAHSAFAGPQGLLGFVDRLRALSGGKPVGFKLCVGRRDEFLAIVKAMIATGIVPDFITVDGAEGGTGAAPFEFSDSLGLPLNEGLSFVHNALVGAGLRPRLRVIASGKAVTGFDMVAKMALGADMVNMARPMMFALGCIQARRCHLNTCPTGVTTQDPARAAAIDVEHHGERVRRFHDATIRGFRDILGAMGHESPDTLGPGDIFRRLDDGRAAPYAAVYPQLEPGALLGPTVPEPFRADWLAARADRF